jgi:hypothetical protein
VISSAGLQNSGLGALRGVFGAGSICNEYVSSRDSVRDLARAAAGLGPVKRVAHTAGLSPVQAPPPAILQVNLVGAAHSLGELGQVVAGSARKLESSPMWKKHVPFDRPVIDKSRPAATAVLQRVECCGGERGGVTPRIESLGSREGLFGIGAMATVMVRRPRPGIPPSGRHAAVRRTRALPIETALSFSSLSSAHILLPVLRSSQVTQTDPFQGDAVADDEQALCGRAMALARGLAAHVCCAATASSSAVTPSAGSASATLVSRVTACAARRCMTSPRKRAWARRCTPTATLRRLRAVKRSYDPGGAIRANHPGHAVPGVGSRVLPGSGGAHLQRPPGDGTTDDLDAGSGARLQPGALSLRASV